MKIQIWVKDNTVADLKNLGIDSPGQYKLADMNIAKMDVRAYWISPHKEDETGSHNILIYTTFDNFSSPYSVQLKEKLDQIIANHDL